MRARTITALAMLDESREARVVRYLVQADLITKENPVIDLRDTDLRGVDLKGIDLNHRNLARDYLTDADLSGADLTYTELSNTALSDTDLSGADFPHGDYPFEAGIAIISRRWRDLLVRNLLQALDK